MSEVDRLSNSGLYPALPIADGRRDQGKSDGKAASQKDHDTEHETADSASSARPRKSLIDEYA